MSFFARLQHLLLLLAVLTASLAAQQTRRVPSDYSSIQAAIDASSTGDTVLVAPGTYPEHLTLAGKEITLLSSGGPSVTFLDGSSTGTVLTISSTPSLATTISGFTVQHGLAALVDPAAPAAAGILLQNAGATISGNIFLHNSGPELTASHSSVNLLSNTVSTAPTTTCYSALTPYTNAGIVLLGSTSLLDSTSTPIPSALVGNTVLGDGTSCSGVAVLLSSHTEPLLLWNNILRNSYTALIADSLTSLTLFQNLIYDNTDGAIVLFDNTNPSPEVEPPTLHLINNTVVNNSTSNSSGDTPEISLSDVAGRTEFVNNILVGTTSSHPVLGCTSPTAGSSPWPLILDHNDLFNTTRAPNSLISPTCTSVLSPFPLDQLSRNGNFSADPQLTGSTDLHPLPNSPVLDRGNNSAPRLVLPPAAPDPSLTPLLSQDIAGNPRITNSTGAASAIVDLGAYERSGFTASDSTALDLTPATGSNGATTLTATLHIPPSTITPAGTVTFFQNGTLVGTAPLTALDPSTASATLPLTAPIPGWAALTASVAPYAADPSTSVVRYSNLASTPTAATTTLTLAASPSTQTLNQPITLTARLGSLSSLNTPGPIPPGALTLTQDGAFLSNLQPDSTGLVTYTVPAPGLGPHTWTVTYAGTSSYSSATASTAATVTAPTPTAMSASISPLPASLGAPVVLTTVVSATSGSATPTGSVTITDGTTVLATLPLSSGSATVTTSTLGLGTHTLTFTYVPDPGFSPVSTTRTVTIGGLATVTTLSATPNPSPLTTSPTITAAVHYTAASSSTPTGTLSVYDGTTLLFSSPNPAVSLPATFTTAGVHHLSATFTPATAADLTSSAALDLTLTAAPALVTSLTLSPTTITLGNGFSFTTAITPASALPNGTTLRLFQDGVLISTTPLSYNASTSALSTNGPVTIGSHQFYETVTSAQGTLLSTSNTVTLQVNPAPVTLALAASPASALAPVTLTASLTLSPVYANVIPSGTVTFSDGSTPLGTASINSLGIATLTLASLTPGPHTLSATFAGTTQLPPATAPSVTETILPAPTITTFAVTPSGNTGAFSTITLSGHVTAPTVSVALNSSACGGPCPPAVVEFVLNGPNPIAQAVVDPSGNAVATVHLPAGTANFAAYFGGNSFFAGSTTAMESLTITPNAGALTLSSTATSIQQNVPVTLAALFTPGVTLPGVHPTGTVTVTDSLGSSTSIPLTSAAGQLTGSAALTVSPAAVGTHTLTVTYSGDANNLPATAFLTLTVTAPVTPPPPSQDFQLALSTPALTLATTHHTTMQVTLSTIGGLSDTIHLTCANLPPNASCTFSPATLRVGQNTSSNPAAATYTSTVSVDTDFILNWAHTSSPAAPILALTFPASALLLLLRRRSRSLPHLLALLLLTAAATLPLTACGNKEPGHTDPGTYTVHVTAHADTMSADRSAPFTLTVTK